MKIKINKRETNQETHNHDNITISKRKNTDSYLFKRKTMTNNNDEIAPLNWPTDEKMLASLLASHVLDNKNDYMTSWHEVNDYEPAEGLFEDSDDDNHDIITPDVHPVIKNTSIIWASDADNHEFNDAIKPDDLPHVLTRVQKSAEARKNRTKMKAEVFTPSWVCSLQNDMADDYMFNKDGVFGKVDVPNKIWIPNKNKIPFNSMNDRIEFIISRRMEITCGEAPYICQRYDATTGAVIPVINENGCYARSGILDRKLRVITENTELNADNETWCELAMIALKATYGYEWQGDNLLIARYNVINDIIEWHHAIYPDDELSIEYIRSLYEIASWNIWQMDGLKQVAPSSCSHTCKSCKDKLAYNHDGIYPVISWWNPSSDNDEPSYDELRPYSCIVEYNSVRTDK